MTILSYFAGERKVQNKQNRQGKGQIQINNAKSHILRLWWKTMYVKPHFHAHVKFVIVCTLQKYQSGK